MKGKLINRWLKRSVVLLAGLWPVFSQAQFRSAIDVQEWSKAKVVLASGDTLYGGLVFYRTQDVINVQHSDGSTSSFSPVNVAYFVAQGTRGGSSHFFRTLLWDQGKDYSDFKKPTFFEQLNEGPLTLVMRETYVRQNPYSSGYYRNSYFYDPYYYPMANQWVDQVKELYYVLLPDGEVVTLRNVRKDLHRLFGDKSEKVKAFVKKNRLDYERPHELVAIINYFNSLGTTGL